ncbi:MAG: glycosyltransferase family 4 protein [Magnetospirillum sp.]|jgi:colanic acid biosynthesis glycosyl transferase WcaI|nr:glycosyltransferase family 4 protein [Magnetospirillum sp.]
MRILVHDFPGHAFPVQLSRALAHRGHTVRHLCFPAFQAPKGPLARRADDPANFEVAFLELDAPFEKHSFVKRWRQERELAGATQAAIASFAPDAVLAGNAPLDVQAASYRGARAANAAFVYWLQDLVGFAMRKILGRKLGLPGTLVGMAYEAKERRLMCKSDAVVAITDDFRPLLAKWGVAAERLHIVENWAAREEVAAASRDNAWAREHGLVGRTVFLYSGTLGLKHDPSLLLDLAKSQPDAALVVNSEGLGADWLRARGPEAPNMLILPFQPFERLGEVLASADILVAILEPDAGVFSVPSKVLTYLCAGRPLLVAIPPENLAARLVLREGAGLAAAPGDRAAFLAAASRLAAEPALRAAMGAKALDYAAKTFDIAAIARRFEAILEQAIRTRKK